MKKILFALYTITFGCLLSSAVFAAGTVTTCDEPSLRTALAGGGAVIFACDGTITLTSTLTITNNTTLDANGHSIVLSGGGAIRILKITTGISVTIKNLTLANGSVIGVNGNPGVDGAEEHGGAIFLDGGNLSLLDCRLWTNSVTGGAGGNGSPNGSGGAASGGAIYLLGGTFNATNSDFVGNLTVGGAGGTNTQFGGAVGTGGKSWGGAIHNKNGLVSLDNCRVFSNEVRGGRAPESGSGNAGISGEAAGGALVNDGGTSTLSRCYFYSNRGTIPQPIGPFGGSGAAARGGAICNLAGA